MPISEKSTRELNELLGVNWGEAGLTRRDLLLAMAAGWAVIGSGNLARDSTAGGRRVSRRAQELEILIRNGRVVNADGVREVDVRIVGELITEVGSNLEQSVGSRLIDASGHLVIPGAIDPHTHLHPPFADDIRTGSEAALAGGITTVGTFAFPQPGENALAAMDRMEEEIGAQAIADVFLHASTWPPTSEYAALMPVLAERGQPSIKIFMARPDFGAHLGNVIRVLEAARDAGVVTLIHCEDQPILDAAARRLESLGRTSLQYYAESRPVLAEAAATQQAAAMCEATGAPMQVVHISSARALQACRNPHTSGLPLFVEVRPMYLYLTKERLEGPDGPLFVGQPPLRTSADAEALWRGLADKTIDVLATDHAPWTRAQKLDPELSITRFRPGLSSLRFMLPLFFSEGVLKRQLPLERFVEATSTSAARILGLFPRKGVIQEGAVADVVVFDPRRTAVVTSENDPSRADYSVYEGWEVTGWPEITIRRGEIVYEDGKVVGKVGSGRLVSREPWSG